MTDILKYVLLSIVVIIILLIIVMIIRRVKNVRKVKRLSNSEKVYMVNHFAQNFGYHYKGKDDLLITNIDAWQRKFGYEWAFDETAVHWNMVFQCIPVYFYYMGKTWLIEFWKGQYGITSGCEVGIYYTDKFVEPEDYRKTHFKAVSDEDMLDISIYLTTKSEEIAHAEALHWWLGAFKIGRHIRADKMHAFYRIRFSQSEMKWEFIRGLKKTGFPMEHVKESGKQVMLYHTDENALNDEKIRKYRNAFAYSKNELLMILYKSYTCPFKDNASRILFCYYQAPVFLRHLLKYNETKKRYRV